MASTLKTNPMGHVYSLHLLHEDAVCELVRACDKHPLWPERFTHLNLEELIERLQSSRALNDSPDGCQATAVSVISEEYSEFIEQVILGDIAAARKELVQTMAMLMRAYIHLGDYIQSGIETEGDQA